MTLALQYIAQGPVSWTTALTRDSWLSALPRKEAEAEIEARAGPADGATWELRTVSSEGDGRTAVFLVEFPSGLETELILDLVDEGGWKIRDVRTFGERQPAAPVVAAGPAGKGKPSADGSGAKAVLAAAALVGVAVLGLAMAARRSRRGLALALAAGGAALVAVAAVLSLARGQAPPSSSAQSPPAPGVSAPAHRLGALREARVTTAGSNPEAIRSALAGLPNTGTARDVANLWRAEWALHERDLTRAGALLHLFSPEAPAPEVAILRARLAFLERRPADMARDYQTAKRLGPDNDGLSIEAAALLALMDDAESADRYILEAAHDGSRLAEVSYSQAEYWIREQRGLDAENWFKRAWQLRPVERADLFPQGVFWDLLRRPDLWSYLQLASAAEPTVTSPEIGKAAIAVPADVQARLCGAYLRFRRGAATVNVPGGAALAPIGTPVDDAGAWSRAEQERALASLPRLRDPGAAGAVLLQPQLRRQMEIAANALADRRRWQDLVALTDASADAVERLPSSLVVLRAEALRRVHREGDARAFLDKIVTSEPFARRSSPGDLFDLAQVLSSLGEFDRAIQCAEKGSAKLKVPVGRSLIQRIRMEHRLSASYATLDSEHFSIRYPRAHPESGSRKLAAVLEGERERLRRWIPLQSAAKTEVQLLWFDDFQRTFSDAVEIVGLFDGKIRLPFAGGESLDFSDPAIVSVVTHELAHAMISEITRDGAPHWFHEGLAQHVEMGPQDFNPIPLSESRGRFLSLPVVEGVLEGLPAPDLAETSYDEARWMLHYLEAAHGPGAIHRLLFAFRDGAGTADALKRLSYASVPAFEERFKQWCRLPGSNAWSTPVLRYLGDRPRSARLPAALDEDAHRMRAEDALTVPTPQPR